MEATTTLTKQKTISELTRSTHGKLIDYVQIGRASAEADSDFFAHLIAWNARKGEVRDSKAALPAIGIAAAKGTRNIVAAENAAAHLADLDPRTFSKVSCDREFIHAAFGSYQPKVLRRLVERYLRDIEADHRRWEPVVVQHREVLHRLYATYRVKPSDVTHAVLFKGDAPAGTIFDAIRRLSTMDPVEAAGTIVARKIPFLVAQGAMGAKMKHPDVLLALVGRMTPNELVTNAKRLEKLGIKEHPALRAAFDEAIEKTGKSKRGRSTLKASQAASAVGDATMRAKFKRLQEAQLDRVSIDGDWLILGDRSPSMEYSVGVARQIAGILARAVVGTVTLVFFDGTPRAFDVTGKTLDEINQITNAVHAGGSGTSIGCGLAWMLEKNRPVDGIAIVSDGEENTMPMFAQVYVRYCEKMDKLPPVYFYETKGGGNNLSRTCALAGIEVQHFDLRTKAIDYYSLPNLVQTMRASRYGLLDEIMSTPLKTLDAVLDKTIGAKVFATI